MVLTSHHVCGTVSATGKAARLRRKTGPLLRMTNRSAVRDQHLAEAPPRCFSVRTESVVAHSVG